MWLKTCLDQMLSLKAKKPSQLFVYKINEQVELYNRKESQNLRMVVDRRDF